MPAVTLTPADLKTFVPGLTDAMAQELIDTTLARLRRKYPCLFEPGLSEDDELTARGIIRDAILRRIDSGSGAVQSEKKGPFDTVYLPPDKRHGLFTEADVTELTSICAGLTEPAGPAVPAGCFPPAPRDLFPQR